ncbi:MAG: vancomycin resistance protein YoaR [Glaciecola sp.]
MNARVRLATISVASLITVTALSGFALRASHAGTILPGVSASGIELGGLTQDEAVDALNASSQERAAAPIAVTFEGATQTLSAADFGYAVDSDAAAAAAFEIGRNGNLLTTTLRQIRATFGKDQDLVLTSSLDEARLGLQVEILAASIDQDAGIGELLGNPSTLEVTPIAAKRGLVVDREATTEALRDAADRDGPDQIDLQVTVQEPSVPLSAIEAAATRAEAAIVDGLTLFHDDVEVRFTPEQLISMLTLRLDGDGDVRLDTRTTDVERAFGQSAGRFEVQPVDADFQVPRDPGVIVDAKAALTWSPRPANIPVSLSTPGRTFDATLTARQIGDLLERGVDRAAIALRDVAANFTKQDAESLGINELLGTFTTYHSCCQGRVRNIQKLADLVDDRLVLPGEQFSINQISGIRTCESGFAAAGMILNGEIVDSCGGGVSQFGTTMFNAAFFAGLQLDKWKAHSFYISRYPMGREATLNFPSPDIDVKFTNNTGHGLLVKTAHTSTSITVSIYGQSKVTSVEATRSGTFKPRNFTTERRANPELAAGKEVRIQSGAGGFSVRVNRFITFADGAVSEDEIVTVYVPQREIIEYGTGEAAPAPTPEPAPEPSPSASPSPSPSASPEPSPSASPEPSPSASPEPSPSASPEPSPEPSDPPAPTP